MSVNPIPFEIPAKFRTAIQRGAIRRVGALLLRTDNNKIVGHVQETAGFPQLPIPTNPLSLVLQGGKLASSITQNVQLEQIKGTLSILKLMNGATLGASILGVGVSVAGFMIINKKLNVIAGQIDQLKHTLSKTNGNTELLKNSMLARDRATLKSLLFEANAAWEKNDPIRVWTNIGAALDREERYYRELIDGGQGGHNGIFLDDSAALGLAIAAYEANQVLAATRFQCLLLTNELGVAKLYAEDFAKWQDHAFADVAPSDIVAAKTPIHANLANQPEDDVRVTVRRDAALFMECVREIEANAQSQPELVKTLIARDINGFEYIKSLRNETKNPLLILERPEVSGPNIKKSPENHSFG